MCYPTSAPHTMLHAQLGLQKLRSFEYSVEFKFYMSMSSFYFPTPEAAPYPEDVE